jgi:hypothetical protein
LIKFIRSHSASKFLPQPQGRNSTAERSDSPARVARQARGNPPARLATRKVVARAIFAASCMATHRVVAPAIRTGVSAVFPPITQRTKDPTTQTTRVHHHTLPSRKVLWNICGLHDEWWRNQSNVQFDSQSSQCPRPK